MSRSASRLLAASLLVVLRLAGTARAAEEADWSTLEGYAIWANRALSSLPEGVQLLDPLAQRLVELTSERRRDADADLQRLETDAELLPAARAHALDMLQRGYVDHVTPVGLHPSDRVVQAQHHYEGDRPMGRAGPELETSIRNPIRLKHRGGRKLIMTPEGAPVPPRKPTRDDTLIKALVRPHRRRPRIESGRARSITGLAEQQGVTGAYVCRLLALTCLAPEIVEAILDGRQPTGRRLAEMLGNGPGGWEEQRRAFGFR